LFIVEHVPTTGHASICYLYGGSLVIVKVSYIE